MGWNIGIVTAKASSGGSTQAEMNATESLSQDSHYTVPLGKTFYLLKAELNAAKLTGGTAPIVEFRGMARPGGPGAAWLMLFDKRMDTALDDELDIEPAFPARMVARTDVRFRTDVDQNSTESRSRMYGLLIDD